MLHAITNLDIPERCAAALEWRDADELPQLPAAAGAAAGAAVPPPAPAVARARSHGRGRAGVGGAPGRLPAARPRGAAPGLCRRRRLQGLAVLALVLPAAAAVAVGAADVRVDAAALGAAHPRGGRRRRPRAAARPRASGCRRPVRGAATLHGSAAIIRCGPGPPGCYTGSIACLRLVLRGSVVAAVSRAAACLRARDVPSTRLVRRSIPLFAECANRAWPDISPTALCRRPVSARFRGTTHCQHATLQLRRCIGRALRCRDAEAGLLPAPRLCCRRQRAGVGGRAWPDVFTNCTDSSTLSTRAPTKFAALCQAGCESCTKWTTPYTSPIAINIKGISQRIPLQTLMYQNKKLVGIFCEDLSRTSVTWEQFCY
ncbi:uncharacterized protein LOC126278049 isoform X1 [Schistocerca gregaria]|uniref:uncharacterized protein LOC126278049 isoform X1 n=1 Tax=Schistocerca gregaria TaxID=7010 RepID=UPI00211DE4C2|nr:uncharacterized protein LOC126278049 isoform X1 [Schistocerca gregaria]